MSAEGGPSTSRSPGAGASEELAFALAQRPSVNGGTAVVLATAGPPPAIALLSTGDVSLQESRVRIAVYAGSSAVARLGGSCTLLVPAGSVALRAVIEPATAREAGALTVIEGPLRAIAPTVEPPWELTLSFRRSTDDAAAKTYVEYWGAVRAWLESGAHGIAPAPPVR